MATSVFTGAAATKDTFDPPDGVLAKIEDAIIGITGSGGAASIADRLDELQSSLLALLEVLKSIVFLLELQTG